jgi:hypothetical protein
VSSLDRTDQDMNKLLGVATFLHGRHYR